MLNYQGYRCRLLDRAQACRLWNDGQPGLANLIHSALYLGQWPGVSFSPTITRVGAVIADSSSKTLALEKQIMRSVRAFSFG